MRTGFAPHPYLGDGHVSNVRIGTELKKESRLEQMIPAEKLPTVRSSLEYTAGDHQLVTAERQRDRVSYENEKQQIVRGTIIPQLLPIGSRVKLARQPPYDIDIGAQGLVTRWYKHLMSVSFEGYYALWVERRHVEPIINSPTYHEPIINVESELRNPGIRGRGLDMLGDLLGLPREWSKVNTSRPESDREYRERLLEAV